MKLRVQHVRLSRDRALWPVLLLLLLGVLVPTACLLWFMNTAIRNERLLARQRVLEAYRGNLAVIRDWIHQRWEHTSRDLEQAGAERRPALTFARLVREGVCDSAVVFGAGGSVAYPSESFVERGTAIRSAAWGRARELEHTSGDLRAAARAYASLAASATGADEAARAIQAQARCLLRAGDGAAAAALVAGEFAGNRLARASDETGRLIAADLELMALETLRDARLHPYAQITKRLAARLADYANPALGSDQRRFLMRQVRELGMETPLLPAEELAADWVEKARSGRISHQPVLRRSPLPGVWQMASPDGRVLALFREDTVRSRIGQALSQRPLPEAVHLQALSPDDPEPAAEALHEFLLAGERLPGWRVMMSWDDRQLLDQATAQETASYFWIAILVVAATSILALLIAWAVRRQMRLAGLKNDLVATVSHELKTPLASMRLLVDTLLDSPQWEPQRVREYLELVSRENNRLSRLIDNFLTFSRMERNKHALHFRELRAEHIVEAAAQAAGERLQGDGCRFEIDIAPGLPAVQGDADALVTVLVNLLDNAYKYSEPERRIVLRAFLEANQLSFSVQDNGIGLSPRDRKKIFERFYQADQRLSRSAGGCGLGLSIVQHIVRAHGGAIEVASDLGSGSTFTVRIPSAAAPAQQPQQALVR